MGSTGTRQTHPGIVFIMIFIIIFSSFKREHAQEAQPAVTARAPTPSQPELPFRSFHGYRQMNTSPPVEQGEYYMEPKSAPFDAAMLAELHAKEEAHLSPLSNFKESFFFQAKLQNEAIQCFELRAHMAALVLRHPYPTTLLHTSEMN